MINEIKQFEKERECVVCHKNFVIKSIRDARSLCPVCNFFLELSIKNAKLDFGHSIAKMDKKSRNKKLSAFRKKIAEYNRGLYLDDDMVLVRI